MVGLRILACIQTGLLAAILITAGPRAGQRIGAALLVTCALVLAWYAPGPPLARGLLAFLAVGSLMIATKMACSTEQPLTLSDRLLQCVSLPDEMRPPRGPANLSAWALIRMVIDLMMVGLALLVLFHARRLDGGMHSLERWSAGVVLFYAGAQFVFDFARLICLAAGLSLDSLHRTPIAARSVTEFWGQRWNRIVSAWLHYLVFLPLARRRWPRLGLFCAFLISGVLHGWPVLMAIGLSSALAMLMFFVVQGVLVLTEHRLRIQSWPVPLARAWTWAVLLASSPLFVDPDLRIFGL